MASIGSLNASLKLESASFIRDLTKASQAVAQNTNAMQRSMAQLQGSFASATGSIKTFVAGFATIATVRTLAGLGADAIKAADEVGQAATRLGVAADALQRFRFAADQADVGTEQLDAALKLFSQNLAQGKIAAQGKDIADAFRNYIEQIANAPTQLQKVALAQQAFGKQWQTALLLAAQGADEFNRQSQNAFVFSQKILDTASELDNQFKAIRNAVEIGFDTGFIEGFSGALDATQDQLKLINDTAREFGQQVGAGFKFVSDTAQVIIGGLRTINEELKPISDFLDRIAGVKPQSTLPSLSFEQMQKDFGNTGKVNLDLGVPQATEQQQKFAKSLQLSVDETNALIAATKDGQATFNSVRDQFEATQAVMRQGIDTSSAYGQSLIKLGVSARQSSRELAAAEEQMRFLPGLAQQFGDAISSSFADAVVNGEKFSDVLTNLTKDLERLAINAFLKQLIGAAATSSSAGTGVLGALFHSGGIVGSSAVASRLLPASVFDHAPRLHSGLKADEFPAILQAGEQVIPRGEGQQPILVQVKNLPGQSAEASQPRQVGGQTVVDLIIGTVKRGFSNRDFDSEMALFGATRGAKVR